MGADVRRAFTGASGSGRTDREAVAGAGPLVRSCFSSAQPVGREKVRVPRRRLGARRRGQLAVYEGIAEGARACGECVRCSAPGGWAAVGAGDSKRKLRRVVVSRSGQ